MKLFNKINWNLFIISLYVGLFFCYILTPEPRIVIKYPTPDNINDVIYIDNSDNCYKYNAHIVNCPSDLSKISDSNLNI